MTFGELDRRCSSVALQLLELEVGVEDIVPVYFEKSKWAVVAIVGVIKAGAAFVLMDAGFRIDLLRKVCHTVEARVILSSHPCLPAAEDWSSRWCVSTLVGRIQALCKLCSNT